MRQLGALGSSLLFLLAATAASAQSSGEPQKFLRVTVGDQSWSVQINQPGFIVDVAFSSGYLQAHNKETGIDLAVTLKRQDTDRPGGCAGWLSSERARISSITLGKATNLISREIKGIPIFEYSLNVMGLKSQQFLATISNDDHCVQLLMSKDKFKPSEEQLFTSILDATEIITVDVTGSPSSAGTVEPATNVPPPPQEKAPKPAPAPPDLYRSSFSGSTYQNEFFGFSIAFPQGWEHAHLDVLRKDDEKRRAEERDAVAKQTGRADLVQSGVLSVPASFTLMIARNNTGSGEPTEGYSVIVIEAVEQSLPDIPPELRGAKGSCGDVYYQEDGGVRSMKPMSKVTDVQFGDRTFAQRDFKFEDNGKKRFVRMLATCADKYYLVLHFAAYSPDEVQRLAEVAKSLHFVVPPKDGR